MTPLLVVLLLGAEPDFVKVDEVDGFVVEARELPGLRLPELRLSTTTDKTPRSLCDAVYGDGKLDAEQPNVTQRTVLEESPHERLTYEQLKPAVIAHRDTVLRTRRVLGDDGGCEVHVDAVNGTGPKTPDGWVRITKLHGHWRFAPTPEGGSRVVYTVFSDPGGSVPAFLVRAGMKGSVLAWAKLVLRRGKAPAAEAGAP